MSYTARSCGSWIIVTVFLGLHLSGLLGYGGQENKAEVMSLQRTGWNIHASRFMYPPVFAVIPPESSPAFYLCRMTGAGTEQSVQSPKPEVDLAPIWSALPAGAGYEVVIDAQDSDGRTLARTNFKFFKVAEFGGPYRPAKCSYVESGRRCAEYLRKTLEPWKRGETTPLPYPSLFGAAFIRLLVTDAQFEPGSERAREALEIAGRIAQYLIDHSTPKDWAYPNMPLSHPPGQYLQISRSAMTGLAYVDLYEATKDATYLEAAYRIAETLASKQLPEGRWYFRVDPQTGEVREDYTSDQAQAICFLDRLIRYHGRQDLIPVRDRALRWMLENPVKTRLWQQQWDDVLLRPPYSNLQFYDTVFLAEYLLANATPENDYLQIAAELFKFVEDQFVLWENSFNRQYIAPSVLEQYDCYFPIDWHVAHYIRFCQAMHAATKEEIYLKKARAMADTLTAVQHPEGFYPTWMTTKQPSESGELVEITYEGLWPNCMSYAAEILIRFDTYLKRQAQD